MGHVSCDLTGGYKCIQSLLWPTRINEVLPFPLPLDAQLWSSASFSAWEKCSSWLPDIMKVTEPASGKCCPNLGLCEQILGFSVCTGL